MAATNFDPVAIVWDFGTKLIDGKIGDVLKIKEIQGLIKDNPYKDGKASTSSVVARSAGSTLQFPIIITDDINVAAADIIRGMDEIENAGLTGQAILMNQNIKADELNNNEFIKKIHRNVKTLESVFDPIMLDCECVTEEAITGNMINQVLFGESVTPTIMSKLTNESRRSLYSSDVPRGFEHLFATFEDGEKINNDNRDEYDIDDGEKNKRDKGKIKLKKVGDDKDGLTVGKTLDRQEQDEIEKDMSKKYAGKNPQDSYSYEKLNQMQPYPLPIRVFSTTETGDFTRPVDVVIGIKSVLHPIKRKNLVDALPRTLDDSSAIMKFIRWTSGELKFFKDILLGVDENKADAIDISKRKGDAGANWLVTLKNAARKRDLFISTQGKIMKDQAIIPNATLVVSQATVDEMKARHGWDLSDVGTVKKLAKKLFLMKFIIIDLGSNMMKIIHPETDPDFDTMSLGTVQTKVDKSEDAGLLRELRKVISNSNK
jgi:hypothetical protein